MIHFTKDDLESIRASDLFDAEWYLANNPDVRALGIDPAEHYLWLGARLGRRPSPRFDAESYAARHLDAAFTDENPLLHYLRRRARWARAEAGTRAAGEGSAPAAGPAPDAEPTPPPPPEPAANGRPASLNASSYHSGNPFRYRPVEELRQAIRDYQAAKAARPADAPRIAFFSAISGGFEAQKVHERLDPRVDYVLFVDSPTPTTGLYEMRGAHYHSADPRRTARYVKTHPHHLLAGYDVAVWIDSNIIIRGGKAYAMLDAFLASDRAVAGIPHPRRSSVFEEGEECIARAMDDREILDAQLARYRATGFDCDDLIETNLMMFKLGDPRIAAFLDGWWAEIERGSRRDQISVNYALGKAEIEWLPLTEKRTSTRNHPDFALLAHDPQAGNVDEVVAALATGTFDPHAGPSYRAVRDQRLERVRGTAIDIVVCVHNALADVRLCLASLQEAKGHARQRIILVDDGSDGETAAFLADYAGAHEDVVLIRNEEAVGYTRAANIGMKASDGEVVIILNSDTIVTADWAEKLAEALLSTGRGGIVGPVSNAASHQSIPEHRGTRDQTAINELPPALDPEAMNRACEEWTAADVLPLTPLVHGFCFGISRALIDAIGVFDEDSFPRGYGEENDYCLRAADAGFALVVATHTYVFHAKSRSYVGPERIRLMAHGGEMLRTLHGRARVERAVAGMRNNPVLVGLRKAAAALYAEAAAKPGTLPPAAPALPRPARPPARPRVPSGYPHIRRSLDLLDFAVLSPDELRANLAFADNRTPLDAPPATATWFIPDTHHVLKGGVRTIFSTAQHFTRRWGTANRFVIVAKPGQQVDTGAMDAALRQHFPDLDAAVSVHTAGDDVAALPPSDIGICSLWTTAYVLARFNQTRRKFYFMQDFEPSFYPAGTVYGAIEATYRFGFSCIANTEGVAGRYRGYSDDVMAFSPAVDRTVFHEDRLKRSPGRPARVVFYGRPANERNAFGLGISALMRLKDKMGEGVDIVSVGADWAESEFGLSGVVRNLGLLGSLEEVARLYRQSDVGLVFMFTPHPSYQPLEYMASGCVTVTNRNAANGWLLKDGENCLTVEPIPEIIAGEVAALLGDQARWRALRAAGLETVAGLDWDRAMADIEAFVLS